MNKIGKHTMDKTTWRNGEWTDELDEIKWSIFIGGYEYKCAIIRGCFGQLCGYVIINEDHGALKYNPVNFNVHGGITWNGRSVEKDSEDEDTSGEIWLGFDCAHMDDLIPYDPLHELMAAKKAAEGVTFEYPSHKTYKNITFVTKEIEELVKQFETLR